MEMEEEENITREREKQRCHLALNEGKENAHRNKLFDSSGPLRERETDIQEDVIQGMDGWIDGWRGEEKKQRTKHQQKKMIPVSFHPFWHEKVTRCKFIISHYSPLLSLKASRHSESYMSSSFIDLLHDLLL